MVGPSCPWGGSGGTQVFWVSHGGGGGGRGSRCPLGSQEGSRYPMGDPGVSWRGQEGPRWHRGGDQEGSGYLKVGSSVPGRVRRDPSDIWGGSRCPWGCQVSNEGSWMSLEVVPVSKGGLGGTYWGSQMTHGVVQVSPEGSAVTQVTHREVQVSMGGIRRDSIGGPR